MPDIEYGEILEALNDKVDLDGSWSAPTSQYVDLTWPASGVRLTAPEDGYFRGKCYCNASGFLYMCNASNDIRMRAQNNYATDRECFIPVKKGQEVIVVYENMNDSSPSIRFIYAQKTN